VILHHNIKLHSDSHFTVKGDSLTVSRSMSTLAPQIEHFISLLAATALLRGLGDTGDLAA
jgi:hypothetical protein